MNKFISKNLHGLIDYSYTLIVPSLPEIVGFKKESTAKHICRGLGIGALSYSLLTKAHWGLIRVLPFKTHLAIDFSVSCFAIVTPWLFTFSKKQVARNTLLAVGIIGLAATLLTNPNDEINTEKQYLFI